MEKSKIRKEVADLINSIKGHTDNIQDSERIPQLELETILNKIEQLYEKAIVLNYLNSRPEKLAVQKIEESIIIINEIENEKETEITIVEEIIEEQPIIISAQELKSETTATEIDLFVDELPKTYEKPIAEKKIDKKEILSTAKKLTKPSISDLKSAIGINDKFQFTNELFGGNNTEYNIAIQNFNSSESLESAVEYYNSLQNLYHWDIESETVKRLLDLVERRYS